MSVYFALRSGDINQIGKALLQVNPIWLLGGVACFAVSAFMEGFIPYTYFRLQKISTRLRACVRVGLIGMYYSSITPAATGGQPMQVYSLKKRGIPPGITSSALAVKFFCWQLSVLLLGAVLWILHPTLVSVHMKEAVWLLPIGFLANGVAVLAVLLLSFARNLVRAIIIFVVSILSKIRLVKDKAKTASKLDAALDDFMTSVNAVKRNFAHLLVMFLLSLIQVFAHMSAIYFIYKGLGLSEHGYFKLLTIQLMLFIAASFTPLPGASGAQEGGFYLFFKPFFADNQIFVAMFLWRFVTYYLSIICGFIAVISDNYKAKGDNEK